jgi:hypothetical protein
VHRRTIAFAVCVLSTALGFAAAADAKVAWFLTPSGNLGCEVADRDVRGSYVFCQSNRRPQTVRMAPNARLSICRGQRCLGDPPENTPTLGYGRRVRVGRFRCTSAASGVRCVVVSSGRGFVIDRASIRPTGAR